MKREHQQIQEPRLVAVCCRPRPVELAFCPVGCREAGLSRPPQPGSRRSQGFPEAPSLPKPLCGALSGSGLTKCCTSSSIRHQNPTPCSFSPFVPDTGVSVTAAFIRGCALDPRWFTCYGFWSSCLMSPLCSCSLSHVFVSSPDVFEDKWPRA